MGYFIEQTWPWWLLAIALAVLITWVVFRDGKRAKRDKQAQEEQARNGERAARERHDVHFGGRDASYDERAAGRAENRTERRAENRAGFGAGAVTRAEQAIGRDESNAGRAGQAIGHDERAAKRDERGYEDSGAVPRADVTRADLTRAEQSVGQPEPVGQPERGAGRGAVGEAEAGIQGERAQVDSRKVRVPGQASSLKERVDQFKEMAEGIRGGRRSR